MKKICKEKCLEHLTYVFFGIYIITLILDGVNITFIYDILKTFIKIVRYICYVEFAVKAFYDWKKGSNITVTMIAVAILCVLITIASKNTDLIFLIFVLMALRKLDFNKLINIAFKASCITFFAIVNLSLLKIIPDWLYSRGDTVRHSLGFIYSTNAIAEYLAIVIMFFFVRRSDATIFELLVLEAINVFLYRYTDGRTSFILITATLMIILLSKVDFIKRIFNSIIIQKILKVICFCLPIVLFIGIHIITYMYSNNNTFAVKINDVLSERIYYTNQAYEEYKVSLFGKDIEWNGWGGHGYIDKDENEVFTYNYVDNSYAKMEFDYGIIFSVIMVVAFTIILVNKYNEKDYWTLASIIIILIWSFIEQHLLRIEKNVFVLFFIPLLEKGQIKLLNYDYIVKKSKCSNKELNDEEIDN